MSTEKNAISSISILTSGKCNLNCSYCFLHKNSSFKDFDNIIQQSWKDKSYLNNIQQCLYKLHADFKQIDHITLWGGEPFLNLVNFNTNIKDILNIFPNIMSLSTSSNFNINVDNFIELLLNFDKYSNNKIEFRLQISMDNIFFNDGHNLPLQFYKNKFKELLEKTNNIKFKNLILLINFRTTTSENNVLELFENEKLLKEYVDYITGLQGYINDINQNSHIRFLSTIFPSATYPTHCSTEQGIRLEHCLRK